MHDGITIVLLPSLMTTVPRPELCSLRLVVLLLTQTAVFRSHLLQFIYEKSLLWFGRSKVFKKVLKMVMWVHNRR